MSRLSAVLAYILILVDWIYVLAFERENRLAVFHVKQAIGLLIYVIGATLAWAALGFLLSLIPFWGFVFAAMLFSLVICVYISAVVFWLVGVINAAQGRAVRLPLVGNWANRLPF